MRSKSCKQPYEVQRVVDQAFVFMQNIVTNTHAPSAIFIFCSKEGCAFREPQKCAHRISMMQSSLNNLEVCLANYKKHLLSMHALLQCYAAFETYLLNNVSKICLLYNDTYTHVPFIQSTLNDYFESDRLCAHLSNYTIISEDYDLVALFGAKRIITDVVHGYVQYITLEDLMVTFMCNTRTELVNKCLIAGTDYNLGLKGFGYAKIVQMTFQQEADLSNTCLMLQGIDVNHSGEMLQFYSIS